MPRFKVLSGVHVQADDRGETVTYKKGEIVETDVELDTLFKNKFERLGEETKTQRDHDDSTDSSGVVMDDTEADKRKALKAAKSQPEPPEPLKSDHSPKAAGARSRGQAEKLEDEGADESAPKAGKAKTLGEDVTDDFPKASTVDLLVFRDGHDYFVADKTVPDKALNDEPFKRKDVTAFINEQAGG